MSTKQGHGVEVTVAVIGVIGALGAAAFANIDKISVLFRTSKSASADANSDDSGTTNDVFPQRKNDSDYCVFFLKNLSHTFVEDYRKKFIVYVQNIRQELPVRSSSIEEAPTPYAAKFEVPCYSNYRVFFGYKLMPIDGSEPSGGSENTFRTIQIGQTVTYSLGLFPRIEYMIGYSAR